MNTEEQTTCQSDAVTPVCWIRRHVTLTPYFSFVLYWPADMNSKSTITLKTPQRKGGITDGSTTDDSGLDPRVPKELSSSTASEGIYLRSIPLLTLLSPTRRKSSKIGPPTCIRSPRAESLYKLIQFQSPRRCVSPPPPTHSCNAHCQNRSGWVRTSSARRAWTASCN